MGRETDGSIERQQSKPEGNLNQSRGWGLLEAKFLQKLKPHPSSSFGIFFTRRWAFLGVDPTFFFFLNIWNVEKEERETLGPCQSNSLFFWQMQHQWQIAQFDINKVDRCRQSCFKTAAMQRCVGWGFFTQQSVCLITNKTTRCLINSTTFTMSSDSCW